MVTLGGLILLNGLIGWIWGSETKTFPSAFSTRPITIGGVAFSIQDFGVIGVTIGAVALLYLLFQFTKVGLGMRAAALAPDASRLLGVRVSWMLALGWGLAAMLGALAGMMTAPTTFLDPNMMQAILLYALAAAVLGGLDSPIGAVVGGLALGVILNLVGTYVDFWGIDLGGQMRLVAGSRSSSASSSSARPASSATPSRGRSDAPLAEAGRARSPSPSSSPRSASSRSRSTPSRRSSSPTSRSTSSRSPA